MRYFLAALFSLFMALVHAQAYAEGKVALVIGNGAYQNATALPNPPNDATDMAAMLESLGFTVISGVNLTQAQMAAKVGDFEEAARSADTTLFFYAGHGLQVNGLNYLVPVDAKLERASSLQFETIESNIVLNAMSGQGRTAIALLDACRNNPLSRSFARSMGASRSTAVTQGLAPPSMGAGGMIIGFATSPGDVAADGEGRNSPFTKALLKNMPVAGLEIQQMMTRVKADVYSETHESQEPWHNSSLRSEVYLTTAPKSDAPAQVTPVDSGLSSVEGEWNAVKDSNSVAVLNAFIASHGDRPVYVALANDRIQEISRAKNFAILDSLKVNIAPPQAEKGAKDLIKELALNLPKDDATPIAKRESGFNWTLDKFFDYAKNANQGNTIYALLGPPTVVLPSPGKNAGSKTRTFSLPQIAKAPALEALLSENPQLSFSAEASTTCLLHWVDRCTFLSKAFFDGLSAAMSANGMDIMNGGNGYFAISRIAGSTDYLLSNNPRSGTDAVAIIAAVVSENLEVKQIFGFDVTPNKLGAASGSPDSDILLTWAAVEGDQLYVSFDATHRCTDQPRKFGFMAKFSMSNQSVAWVSPFSVSDANFVVKGDYIISANGGSCVDDFIYKLDKETGQVLGRFKTPSAVELMDNSSGSLVLQLYDGAVAYQLD